MTYALYVAIIELAAGVYLIFDKDEITTFVAPIFSRLETTSQHTPPYAQALAKNYESWLIDCPGRSCNGAKITKSEYDEEMGYIITYEGTKTNLDGKRVPIMIGNLRKEDIQERKLKSGVNVLWLNPMARHFRLTEDILSETEKSAIERIKQLKRRNASLEEQNKVTLSTKFEALALNMSEKLGRQQK